MGHQRRFAGIAALAAIIVLVCSLTAACGGTGDDSSGDAPPTPGATDTPAGTDTTTPATPGATDTPPASTPGSATDTDPGVQTPGAQSCAQVADCADACADGDQTCFASCLATGTASAQAQLEALDACTESAAQGSCAAACTDFETDACWQCVDPLCMTEITACFGEEAADGSDTTPATTTGNLTCAQMDSCYQGCSETDESCYDNCYDQGTATAQQLDDAIETCIDSAWTAQCQSQCATEDDACWNCIDSACAAQLQACDGDA